MTDEPQNTEETREAFEERMAAETQAEPEEPAKTEYIEFVGQEPYGTEFYRGEHGTHTVFAKDFKQYHDLELGKKEVVWRKGANGRMLVPVSDITPEAADYLASDPMFKRVTL